MSTTSPPSWADAIVCDLSGNPHKVSGTQVLVGDFLRDRLVVWKNLVTDMFQQITELNIDPERPVQVYQSAPNLPPALTVFGSHNQAVGVAVHDYLTPRARTIDEYRQIVERYNTTRQALSTTILELTGKVEAEFEKIGASLKQFKSGNDDTVYTVARNINRIDRTMVANAVVPNANTPLDQYLHSLLATSTLDIDMFGIFPDAFYTYMLASFFRKPGTMPQFAPDETTTLWAIPSNTFTLTPQKFDKDTDPHSWTPGFYLVDAIANTSTPVFGTSTAGEAYVNYDGRAGGQVETQAQELQSLYVDTLKLLADTQQLSVVNNSVASRAFPTQQPLDKLRSLLTDAIQTGPFRNYLALWGELAPSGQDLGTVVKSSALSPTIVNDPATLQIQREATYKRLNLVLGALLEFRSNFGGARSDGSGYADEFFQNLYAPIWLIWEAVRLFGDGSTQSREVIGSVMLGLLVLRAQSFFKYTEQDVVIDLTTTKLYRLTSTQSTHAKGAEILVTREVVRGNEVRNAGEINPTDGIEKNLEYPNIRLFRDSSKDTRVVPEFGLSKSVFGDYVDKFARRGYVMDSDKDDGHLKLQMDATKDTVDASWALWASSADRAQKDKYIQGHLMSRITQAVQAGEALSAMTQIIMTSLTYVLYISTQTTQPLFQGGSQSEPQSVSKLSEFRGGGLVEDLARRVRETTQRLARFTGTDTVLGRLLYFEDVKRDPYPDFLHTALVRAAAYSTQLVGTKLKGYLPTEMAKVPNVATEIWAFIQQRAAPETNELAMVPTLFAQHKPLRNVWTAPTDLQAKPVHENFKGALMYSVFYPPLRQAQEIITTDDIGPRVKDLYMRELTAGIFSNAKTIEGMMQKFETLSNPQQTRVEENNLAQFRTLLQAVVEDAKSGTVKADANLDSLVGSMTGPQLVSFLEWLSKGRLLLNLRQPDAMYEALTQEYFGTTYNVGPSQAVQYMYRAAMRIVCAFLGVNHNIDSDSIILNLNRQNALDVVRKLMSLNLVPVGLDYEGLVVQVAQDEHASNDQNVWDHLFVWQASLSNKRALTDFSTLYVLICRAIQHIVATYLDTVVKVENGYEVVLVSVQAPNSNRSMFQGGAQLDGTFQGGNRITDALRAAKDAVASLVSGKSFDDLDAEFKEAIRLAEGNWPIATIDDKNDQYNILSDLYTALSDKALGQPQQATVQALEERITALAETKDTQPQTVAAATITSATAIAPVPVAAATITSATASAPAPAPAPTSENTALSQLVQALTGTSAGLVATPSVPASAPTNPALGQLVQAVTGNSAGPSVAVSATPNRSDEYRIDFYTIPATIQNDQTLNMLKSVTTFKRDVIAQQIKKHALTRPQSQVVAASPLTWLLQLKDVIPPEFYERVTLSQLDELDAFKGLNVQRPGLMGIDGQLHYLCAYNFSVNTNAVPGSNMGAKLTSKLPVLDCFAYPNFWVNPSVLKPLLEMYKDNMMAQENASSDQLHKYLNALLMHTCPDNLPLVFRTDVGRVIKSNQATQKPLVKRVLEALSKKPGIQMQVHLDPTFNKELRDAQRKSSALFQPNGSQYVVGSDGKSISLTRAARMLMERTVRTAIAGSYAKVDMPMNVQAGQFAGGARHAGLQPPMIVKQLEPFAKANFVDVDSGINGQGRLLSLKLYQLFAEVAELIPDLDAETLLYFLPNYRIGKYGQARNVDKKKLLGGQYINLRGERPVIDAISHIAGLPTLVDQSPLVQSIADSHPEQVEQDKLLQVTQEKEAVSIRMDALVKERLADEQEKLDNPANEKERRTAEARIDALEKGRGKSFRSAVLEVPPAYGLQKWQQTLAGWTDNDKDGLHWFRRSCHVKGVLGTKSYCMWEPNTKTAEKDAKQKNKTVTKPGIPNKPVTLPPSAQSAQMNAVRTTGAASYQQSNARLQAAASNDAVVNRVLKEQSQLATASHEKILRSRPQEVVDGNRGTGAVREFTAWDAAGNEIFTVLPHNLISNIMILAYSALIIYAGSQGASAYQTLYSVQVDDATTKLEAVYPARGAATFFYGFGFGTIVAFLASIVEFFNYWRFRYIFGLVLMSLPIIILGSVGISSLDSENNILSNLLNVDPSGADVEGTDSTSTTPSFWSSLLGTDYTDALTDYTDAVTDARESLAISDMLFIGLGIGVLTAGIMIGIPGGPFHTDRNEAMIHKMRDGEKRETAQRSHIKTHWIIYPILLTVAVIGAGSASIGVATEGGPQIKRTEASVAEDEVGDYTSVQDNVAWPQIQSAIISMVIAVLLLAGLVLIGYVRQRHALTVAAGNQVAKGVESAQARAAPSVYNRPTQPAPKTFGMNSSGLPQGSGRR